MEIEIPFKVLNTFRRGVILQSVPEGIILHLEPGDVITISHFPKEAMTDTSVDVPRRERDARALPNEDGAEKDWRHSLNPRRSDYRHI